MLLLELIVWLTYQLLLSAVTNLIRIPECRASAPVREVDEYDADYDRGRTKKVRRKDGPDGGISAASFQGAWTDRQRQHSEPSPLVSSLGTPDVST